MNNTNIPTIVTCLYDIRGNDDNNRTLDTYLEKGKFILDLPYSIVIFTELKIKDKLLNIIGTAENIKIVTIPMEDTKYYSYLNTIEEMQDKYIITNRSPVKDTPLYIILTYNKIWFLEEAIKSNYFNSTRFVWLDFGITHVAKNPDTINSWIGNIPEKVRLMELSPYGKPDNNEFTNENFKTYFTFIYHNHAAGLISGSGLYLMKFINLFYEQLNNIINDNWYQLDEAIITMVRYKNPEIFNLYYGDYTSIIENYSTYHDDFSLIYYTLNKYIEFSPNPHINKKYLEYGMELLEYLKPTLISDSGIIPNSHLVHFLDKYVILYYYVKNKTQLDPDIVNYLLTTNNKEVINYFLNNNNIKFYKNISEVVYRLQHY